MDIIEEIENRLYNEDIQLDYFSLDTSYAFTIKLEKKHYICLNKDIKFTNAEKKCLLEHEYSHIITDTFYTVENSRLAIKRRELKANDDMVNRLGLVPLVIDMAEQGIGKWEIAQRLEITEDVLEHCFNYAKRKNMKGRKRRNL